MRKAPRTNGYHPEKTGKPAEFIMCIDADDGTTGLVPLQFAGTVSLATEGVTG